MSEIEAREAMAVLLRSAEFRAPSLPAFAREVATPRYRPRWPFEVGYLLPTGRGVEHVVLGSGESWDGALANARRGLRRRKPRAKPGGGAHRSGLLRQLPLLVTLACTLPMYRAQVVQGVARCAPDTVATRLATVDLWGQVQSPTWVDSSAAMLRDPATWARLWPRVAAEAAPFEIERNPAPSPGSRYTLTPPAAPAARFYFLRCENPAGRASCPSNTVCLP